VPENVTSLPVSTVAFVKLSFGGAWPNAARADVIAQNTPKPNFLKFIAAK
jgi:hypothetical protein